MMLPDYATAAAFRSGCKLVEHLLPESYPGWRMSL